MRLMLSKFRALSLFVLVLVMSLSNNQTLFAQSASVKGTVMDETKTPLIGVSVFVKGTQKGTMTDADGKYSLDGLKSTDKLTFSMIGYAEKEVLIGKQAVLVVILEPDSKMLEEIVVTGYQSQRKVDLTGSVSSISANNLSKTMPFSTEQALKGKFAGVQVQNNDGAPGGGITIKIRGASSITAGSAPLYVVDGFPYPVSDNPYDNPLASISPDAIQSISILKDVSSTAIYGAQGANGVVLITTKKGIEGRGEVAAKVSVGFSNLANEIEMLDAEGYMKAYMRDMYGTGRWYQNDFYQEYKDRIWETDPDRFAFYPDFCLQTGLRQNYEISYRGGSERVQNSTTFSYNNEKGIAINTGYDKFYLLSNTSIKLLKNLKLNTNISFEHSKRSGAFWVEGNIFNEIQTFSPLVPKEWTFDQIDENLYYTGKMDNPYRKLNDIEYANVRQYFSAQAELQWDILPGLFAKATFGTRLPKIDIKKFVPKTIQAGFDNGGLATHGYEEGLNLRGAVQLGFNKTWKKVHKFSAGVIYEVNANEREMLSQDYTHFNTDLGWHGIYSAESGNHVTAPRMQYEKVTMMSTVLMANYSYKDKYLAKFSLRADASSKFAPGNRWGIFPSGAFAWRLSEEEFFDSSDWLKRNVDNFKIRLSYGQVGNDQILPYGYINTLTNGDRQGVFENGNITPLYTSRMMNPGIGWETTSEFNGGIDIDMFNNRLNVTLDLYTKKTTDMLLNQHLPLLSGFDKVTRNVGSVSSKGIEFSLGGCLVDTKDFTWTANVNFSANRSKVLSLGNEKVMFEDRYVGQGNSKENVIIQEGLPLGLLYGMQLEGVRNNWNTDNNAVGVAPSWWWAPTREYPYGFPSFADINGDGQLDLNDRTIIGCVNPDFIGGLTTALRWRFIELSMDFSWSYGNDVINGNYYKLMQHGGINNRTKMYYQNTWYANNQEGTFTPAGPIDWSRYYEAATNSDIVEDGSFFKMNNLALTFRLPSKFVDKLKIRDLSLTYSVNNVFCVSNYSGYDPEVSSGNSIENRILSGVDVSSYPYARSHVFTLNFKF